MRAVPAPRPDAAPVTTNTLFLISMTSLLMERAPCPFVTAVAVCLRRRLACVGDALADFVQRTDSRYLAEGRGLLVAAARPVRIVVDQGTRLLLIHRQAVPDGFFAVVVALHQGFACDVIDVGGLGRIEGDVIASAAGRMDAASAHALDDVFVRHHD